MKQMLTERQCILHHELFHRFKQNICVGLTDRRIFMNYVTYLCQLSDVIYRYLSLYLHIEECVNSMRVLFTDEDTRKRYDAIVIARMRMKLFRLFRTNPKRSAADDDTKKIRSIIMSYLAPIDSIKFTSRQMNDKHAYVFADDYTRENAYDINSVYESAKRHALPSPLQEFLSIVALTQTRVATLVEHDTEMLSLESDFDDLILLSTARIPASSSSSTTTTPSTATTRSTTIIDSSSSIRSGISSSSSSSSSGGITDDGSGPVSMEDVLDT
jgi:hypothetical protein